jgi:ankyrin repeat protein
MSTRSLPENPNLDQVRHQARALQRAVRSADPGALDRVRAYGREPSDRFPLSAAQLVIAREYGFSSWPRLRHYLDAVVAYGWTSSPELDGEDPPDALCRLACLTYTASDGPARWAAARRRSAEGVAPHIWSAAALADSATVELMLASDRSLATRRGGPHGWSPLCYLLYSRVAGGDAMATARVLLAAGADPDEGYLWHGLTPPFTLLTGAFGEGEQGPVRQPRHRDSLALARLLLEAGADPNDGQTLYNRMFRRDDDHLELLFEYGLGTGDGGPWRRRLRERLETTSEMLRRVLRWAIEHDQTERVDLLVRHGVDADSAYADGHTPWQVARLAGRTDLADLLARHGAVAPPLAPVDEFVGAVLRVDRPAVERLRAERPGLAERVRRLRPGLVVWATARAGAPAATLLVELGFDVNAYGRADQPIEDSWETALHHAAGAGDAELVDTLLALGADPSRVDARFGATPAAWASHQGHPELARRLAE